MKINREEYKIILTPEEQKLVGLGAVKPYTDTFVVISMCGDVKNRLGGLFVKEIADFDGVCLYLSDLGYKGYENKYFDRVVLECNERIYKEWYETVAYLNDNRSDVVDFIFEGEYHEFLDMYDWVWEFEETDHLKESDFDKTELNGIQGGRSIQDLLGKWELCSVQDKVLIGMDYIEYTDYKWDKIDELIEGTITKSALNIKYGYNTHLTNLVADIREYLIETVKQMKERDL